MPHRHNSAKTGLHLPHLVLMVRRLDSYLCGGLGLLMYILASLDDLGRSVQGDEQDLLFQATFLLDYPRLVPLHPLNPIHLQHLQ